MGDFDTPWIAVDSSCLSRVRRVGGNVEVTLKETGKTYAYLGVPFTVWEGFLSASSKGKYYNWIIKQYPVRGPL